MKLVTRVQYLEEVDKASLHAKTLGKGMNPFLPQLLVNSWAVWIL